jgi:hypothetical protein
LLLDAKFCVPQPRPGDVSHAELIETARWSDCRLVTVTAPAGARQIFANAQVSLTPELAAAVTERTEGWPVGLYLAAVVAKAGNGQHSAVTGDDRYVADYLYREVLAQQPEDMQRFLRRTAVLDQLCGPLCDAICESSGAAEHLRRLEAVSLFLIRSIAAGSGIAITRCSGSSCSESFAASNPPSS